MTVRRAATPVALIMLAVAALCFAYVFDRGRATQDASGEASRRRDVLPGLDAAATSRIELSHGDERLVLERAPDAGGSAWTMLSPRHEQADPAVVDALLAELGLAIKLRDVPASSAVGLDAPRVRGEVQSGRVTYRFALGAPAPVPDGASYMQVEGEGTFVVGSALTKELLRGADAYRDRVLVPIGASDAQRLEVRVAGGAGFTLARTGSSTFRVDGGPRASRESVARIFTALADVRADRFVSDSDADRALADATDGLNVTLEARGAAGPRVELRAGGRCPGVPEDTVVVRTRPDRRAACVPGKALAPLREQSVAAVDARALVSRADEVEELRLERLQGDHFTLDVARRGRSWHQRAPADRDLSGPDADAVDAAVERLASLRAKEGVAPPVVNGSLVARARARIVAVDGTTETLEWGASDARGVTVLRRDDDGATFTVDAGELRPIESLYH
jgi:hypothetical protein